MIEVEKGIPIPTRTRNKSRGRSISELGRELLALEVGDSFSCRTAKFLESVRCMARHHSVKLLTEKQADGTWRAWKIA